MFVDGLGQGGPGPPVLPTVELALPGAAGAAGTGPHGGRLPLPPSRPAAEGAAAAEVRRGSGGRVACRADRLLRAAGAGGGGGRPAGGRGAAGGQRRRQHKRRRWVGPARVRPGPSVRRRRQGLLPGHRPRDCPLGPDGLCPAPLARSRRPPARALRPCRAVHGSGVLPCLPRPGGPPSRCIAAKVSGCLLR